MPVSLAFSRHTWVLLGLLATVAITALILSLATSRERRSGTEASPRVIESLPYLTWVSAEDSAGKKGVTVHDPSRAHPGFNLYSSRESNFAHLIDMDGEVVHRWEATIHGGNMWQVVELLPDGELLVIAADHALFKLDRDSNILWTFAHRVHHDVSVAGNGDLFVLGREPASHVVDGRRITYLNDVIYRLSGDGRLLDKLSIFELFGDRINEQYWSLLEKWLESSDGQRELKEAFETEGLLIKHGTPADLFHTNSVEYLSDEIPGFSKPGDLLISMRELSMVAVVGYYDAQVRWSWGPDELVRQHHPSLLESGHVLIYDNLGGKERKTRVVELDPLSGEIVWEYNGDPPESFFSALRGGAQRLANGNTLLTESDRGRVFEITPDGELVWEFYNPMMLEEEQRRVSIHRMVRIESEALPWLDHGEPGAP